MNLGFILQNFIYDDNDRGFIILTLSLISTDASVILFTQCFHWYAIAAIKKMLYCTCKYILGVESSAQYLITALIAKIKSFHSDIKYTSASV